MCECNQTGKKASRLHTICCYMLTGLRVQRTPEFPERRTGHDAVVLQGDAAVSQSEASNHAWWQACHNGQGQWDMLQACSVATYRSWWSVRDCRSCAQQLSVSKSYIIITVLYSSLFPQSCPLHLYPLFFVCSYSSTPCSYSKFVNIFITLFIFLSQSYDCCISNF